MYRQSLHARIHISVRTHFHQTDKTRLRKGRLSSTCFGTSEIGLELGIVEEIDLFAIDGHQGQSKQERPFCLFNREGSADTVEEFDHGSNTELFDHGSNTELFDHGSNTELFDHGSN